MIKKMTITDNSELATPIVFDPLEEDWSKHLSLSEIGQLVFHPECSRCAWGDETYTFREAEGMAEGHRDETGHRPIPIYFDMYRIFMMSVT